MTSISKLLIFPISKIKCSLCYIQISQQPWWQRSRVLGMKSMVWVQWFHLSVPWSTTERGGKIHFLAKNKVYNVSMETGNFLPVWKWNSRKIEKKTRQKLALSHLPLQLTVTVLVEKRFRRQIKPNDYYAQTAINTFS